MPRFELGKRCLFSDTQAGHKEQFDADVLLEDDFDACAIYRVPDTVPGDSTDDSAASFAEMTLPRNLRLCPSSVIPGVSNISH